MHIFEVHDNGRGVADLAGRLDGSGSGHKILDMLAAQLGGTLTRTNEGGLRTSLTFPSQQGTQLMSLANAFAMS